MNINKIKMLLDTFDVGDEIQVETSTNKYMISFLNKSEEFIYGIEDDILKIPLNEVTKIQFN